DLDLALAERRLTEDAESLLAIGEADLADAESRRLLEQHLSEAGGRDVPHLHGDRGAALLHADHRGVAVADRPEAIVRHRRRLAHEARAGGEQVEIGRASCRERVWMSVVAAPLRKWGT